MEMRVNKNYKRVNHSKEILRLMAPLNAAEKRAVRGFRILTHAFFCMSPERSEKNLLLNKRWECLNNVAPKRQNYIIGIAVQISDLCSSDWMDEAYAKRNR
jgi:hypothetical protein